MNTTHACPHCGSRKYKLIRKGWPGSYLCSLCDKIFDVLEDRLQTWALEEATRRGFRVPVIVGSQASLQILKTAAYWVVDQTDPFGSRLGVVVHGDWEVVCTFDFRIQPGTLDLIDGIQHWKRTI